MADFGMDWRRQWNEQRKEAHRRSSQGEGFDPLGNDPFMGTGEFTTGRDLPTGKQEQSRPPIQENPTFVRPVHWVESQSYDERRRVLSGHQIAAPETFQDYTDSELKGSFIRAGGAERMGISRTDTWKLKRSEIESQTAKFHSAWVPTIEQAAQPFSAAPGKEDFGQVSAGEVEERRQRLGLPSLSPTGLPERASTPQHQLLFQTGAEMGRTRAETYQTLQEGIQRGALGGRWDQRMDREDPTSRTYGQQYLQDTILGANYEQHLAASRSAGTAPKSMTEWATLPQHAQNRYAGQRPIERDQYGNEVFEEDRFNRAGMFSFPTSSITGASFLGQTPSGHIITTWKEGKSEKRVQTLGAHRTLQINTLQASPAFIKEGPLSAKPETQRQNMRGALVLGGDVGGPGAGLFDFGAGARASERVYRSLAPSPTGATLPVQRGAVFSPGSEMALAAGATGEHTGKWRYQVEDVMEQEGGGYGFVLTRSAAANQARLAFKDASTKVQGIETDLSGVTSASGKGLGLQFMGALKDVQGGIFSQYAGLGTSALAQDIYGYLSGAPMQKALQRGAYKGYGLPEQITPESINQYVSGSSYSELGMLPMRSYINQRLGGSLQEIHRPQIMTGQRLKEFRAGGSVVGDPISLGDDRFNVTLRHQALVGDIGKLASHEYAFKRPFLSAEEMESVKRANPAEHQRLYEAGTPVRQRYQEVMNTALATIGERAMPGESRTVGRTEASGLHSAAFQAAGEGLPEEVTPSRGRVARQLIDMMAEGQQGSTPMVLGTNDSPLYLPSPKTMQAMGAPGPWEGSEETRVMRMAAEAFEAFGSGDKDAFNRVLEDRTVTNEIGIEETIPGLRSELAGLAGGGEFVRKTMGTVLDRKTAVGDIAHMSLALKPNEAYIPQLGDPGEQSKMGRLAQVLRFPSQMTRAHDPNAGLILKSKAEAEQLGLNLSVAQFSPEALQGMAGDVDGDKFLAYIRGDATVDKGGNLVSTSTGDIMGDFRGIKNNAFRAANEGAASPMGDMAGTADNPFMTRTQAVQHMRDAVKGARTLTTQQFQEDYEGMAHLRGKIGQLYTPFRAAAGQMSGRAMQSFETMWLASHGRAQRPAEQLPGMERFHTVLKSGLITNPEKWHKGMDPAKRRLGGGVDPLLPQGSPGGIWRTFKTGGKGIEGAFKESVDALTGLVGDEGKYLITPQGIGTLFGGTEEARANIAGAAEAFQASGLSRNDAAALHQSVLDQDMADMVGAPIGQMIMPSATERAMDKATKAELGLSDVAGALGVDEGLLQRQLDIRQLQKDRMMVMGRKGGAVNVVADAMDRLGVPWLGEKIRGRPANDPDEVFDAVMGKRPSIVQSAAQIRRAPAKISRPGISREGARAKAVESMIRGNMRGMSPEETARTGQGFRALGVETPLTRLKNKFFASVPEEQRGEAAKAWSAGLSAYGISTRTDPQTGNAYSDYQSVTGQTYGDVGRQMRVELGLPDQGVGRMMGGGDEMPPWNPQDADIPPEAAGGASDPGSIPMGDLERNRRRADAARASTGSGGGQVPPRKRHPQPPAGPSGTAPPVGGGGGIGSGGSRPPTGGTPTGGGPSSGMPIPLPVVIRTEQKAVTQDHIDKMRRINDQLDSWHATVGKVIDTGGNLNKEQIKYAKSMGGLQEELEGLVLGKQGLGSTKRIAHAEDLMQEFYARGGKGLRGARAYAEGEELRREGLKAQGADPDAEGGGPSGTRMAVARAARGLTSGWEMMRMRRMWAMTGGPVFDKFIPAAAEASMSQFQASAAVGGFQPGQMAGGVAGGLMRFQADQRQSMIEAGRTGYQVWGAGPLSGVQNVMRGAQAVMGPAAGAGLIGGGLASTIGGGGLATLASVGLPIMGAVGAAGGMYAAGRYAWTRAEGTPENELRGRNLRQQSTDRSNDWATRISAGIAELPDLAGAMMRGEATMFGADVWGGGPDKPSVMQWRAQRAARGAALTEKAFDEMNLGERGASLSWAAGELRGQDGAFANYDENQIMQMFQSAAGYMQDFPTDPTQLTEATPRELDIIATTSRDFESYEQLASQLRLGPGGASTLLNQIGYSSAADIRGYEHTLGKWAPVTGGMSMRQREGLVAGVTGAPTEGQIALGRNVPAPVEPIAPPSIRGANRLDPVMGQIIGLQTAGVLPEEYVPDQPSEDWINQQYELMPGYGAFGSVQGQLRAQGYGSETATRFTAAAGAVGGIQGMNAAGALSRGDMGAVRMFSAGQAGMETAGGVPTGRLYDSMLAALESAPVFKEQLKALQELPPLLEESGHAMGTTQMYQGWAEGLSPIGVGGSRWASVVGTATTGGRRGLQERQLGVTAGYQDFQLEQRQMSIDMQGAAQFGGTMTGYGGKSMDTRGSFAIVRELRQLGRQWEDFSQDYGEQQRALSGQQFMENWQVRMGRMPTQFARQREDLAFQGNQQAIQFGWQMEDSQEQLRFATGRDRRRILRQQERSTIMFGMNQGRLDTMGGRVDENERWANEDMERSRRHFEERQALQDTYQGQYRAYIEERRVLEDELQNIQEFQARFNIDSANEQLAKQREMQTELRAINEAYRLMNVTLEDSAAEGQSIANMFAYVVGQVNEGGTLQGAFDSLFSRIQDGLDDITMPSLSIK